MSLIDRRIKGIPITFLAVVVATLLLTIFFGAWAVSADVDEQGRRLSFAIPGSDPSLGGGAVNPSQAAGNGGSGDQDDAEDLGDKWWGKTLLKVCPLH